MTQSVPLYYLLLAVLALLMLYGVPRAIILVLQSARRTVEAIEKNTAAVAALAAKLDEVGKQLELVPKLLDAITKIGSAQLEIMQAQSGAARNPFGKPTGPIPPRDVDTANMEHEISEIMRSEGVTRQEALSRMNSANGGSVWDSNMFVDWRTR